MFLGGLLWWGLFLVVGPGVVPSFRVLGRLVGSGLFGCRLVGGVRSRRLSVFPSVPWLRLPAGRVLWLPVPAGRWWLVGPSVPRGRLRSRFPFPLGCQPLRRARRCWWFHSHACPCCHGLRLSFHAWWRCASCGAGCLRPVGCGGCVGGGVCRRRRCGGGLFCCGCRRCLPAAVVCCGWCWWFRFCRFGFRLRWHPVCSCCGCLRLLVGWWACSCSPSWPLGSSFPCLCSVCSCRRFGFRPGGLCWPAAAPFLWLGCLALLRLRLLVFCGRCRSSRPCGGGGTGWAFVCCFCLLSARSGGRGFVGAGWPWRSGWRFPVGTGAVVVCG